MIENKAVALDPPNADLRAQFAKAVWLRVSEFAEGVAKASDASPSQPIFKTTAKLTEWAGDCVLRTGVGTSKDRLVWWRWRRPVSRLALS
jgi:hypothetical protein